MKKALPVIGLLLLCVLGLAAFQASQNNNPGSGTGTVSSLTATSPIVATPSPTVATGVFSCPTCATTTNGGALAGTSPVTVDSSGNIGCATCATTTNGGALSGTSPISVSAAGAISVAAATTSVKGAVIPRDNLSVDASGDVDWNPNDANVIQEQDDFGSGGITTLVIGSLGWQSTTIANAPTIAGGTSTFPHLGVLNYSASATAANDGGTLSIASLGNLNANVPWTATYIFQLNATANQRVRVGFSSAFGALPPTTGIWLHADIGKLVSASNITNNGIVCTTTACTVTTTAAHGMDMVGQSVTIASATGCARTINATWVVSSIPSTTTYVFQSSGGNETCGGNTPATSTPVAETTMMVEAKNGDNNTGDVTVTDTGLAIDTNWHKVVISSTVAGTVNFAIDGGAPIAISANVPTTGLSPIFQCGTNTTSATQLNIDFFGFKMRGLAR